MHSAREGKGLEFRNVSKTYPGPDGTPRLALDNVSFDLRPGNSVAIVGRSGSGKSTLLHLAAGVDTPTSGGVIIDGQNLADLSDRDRALLRRSRIGLVFQFFYLLSHLSVLDNITLPSLIAGGDCDQSRQRARQLLYRVELLDRADDPIEKLSGGEMQRVALCRALIEKPEIILADEPTGNLDDETARGVMLLMLELARTQQSALLYVTHSREMATLADEIWKLHSGRLDLRGLH